MTDVKIDKEVFHTRLASFIAQWKTDNRSGNALFGGAASIAILIGKSDDTGGYQKNNGFQFWLMGYEFPSTLMLLTTETLYFVTTKKKASYLEPLKGGKIPVEFLIRGKDAAENRKIFEDVNDKIKAAGKIVGTLPKVAASGDFADEWREVFGTISGVEEFDISTAISIAALAVKDEKELRSLRDAARASSGLLRKYLVDEMSEVLDQEKEVSHKKFAAKINDKLEDSQYFTKSLKLSSGFDPEQLDWAYNPTIQSGGKYDLKLSADPDNSNLHAGVIIAALGFRYQVYASLVARTYLVDPNKSQEANYKLLVTVHDAIIKEIKEGVTAKTVYEKALNVIKAKKPELEKHFVKNVGAGIGLESRDTSLLLNAKNTRPLKDGMTLLITTAFDDLVNPNPQDKKSGIYSLMLSDTVRVTAGETVVFTKDAPTDSESASFFFKDEEEQKPEKSKQKRDSKIGAVAQTNVTKTRLRGERATNQDQEKDAARREHQKELHGKKQQEGLERYNQDTGALNGAEQKQFKRFESYKRENQLPIRVKDLIICVDERQQTIVLPIMGRPVPFHINTVKNASRTDEGGFTYLRINFLSPGQGVGRKEDQPFEDPNAHFVRSLTFRSKDIDRIEEITKQITDLKKASVRHEQQKKELEDVVEQDRLTEIRNRRPQRMETVFLRPALEGKRLPGAVEIHQNGLRYIHQSQSQKVDILFSNIKHLFFQPCAHELIVIVHIHLVNPIMVGKKKTKDVQFFREATEMAYDETGNRKRKHRFGDEEEFEAEQEERRRRSQLDKEFRSFAERIADAGREDNVSVDIPYRELGFSGVPSRSNVLIQPSADCLIQLTEPPFLVITLSEIEIVHLERVQFGLKNFDMVCVLRDFQKAPIHINTIPVEMLDAVKDWLDSVDIPFSEGPLNLNWGTIMKTVTQDPHGFFADGGWSFIAEESEAEGEDEEQEESAFEMSDEEVAGLSEEESDADSEFDDDASAEASEDEGSAEEEGEDWDELERKAARKDRDGALDDEEKKPKKR